MMRVGVLSMYWLPVLEDHVGFVGSGDREQTCSCQLER